MFRFSILGFTNTEEGMNDILDESIKAQWSVEPRFVMEMCDLQLPMSASRGRTPASSHGLNNQENNGFGTTISVIVGKGI